MGSERLLTADEVANILGVSQQTLANWRRTGQNDLPFQKLGRLVRYRQTDVEEFLADLDGDEYDDLGDEDEEEEIDEE